MVRFFYKHSLLPCGLIITEEDKAICGVSFCKTRKDFVKNTAANETPLIKKTVQQLDEYFSKKRKTFNLPLSLNGTEFQLKVWNTLQKIPYGETCSYGELAKMIGNPKASRAVGMANNKNPVVIIIPCHRVIGADGSLTGYAGGLDIKKILLGLETA
ncbi:MAG: methylated-DNA--[protein]-cysteine S-methyltransferase [Treponema sp.]|jgi:methylated-DNA-[protein]-cysteine S-methyltransferase|nr:methylated-DNA--[protein]-cysteine S-methyltransferase [Treponema sp.]